MKIIMESFMKSDKNLSLATPNILSHTCMATQRPRRRRVGGRLGNSRKPLRIEARAHRAFD
jgi:hypothetical protein